MAITFTLNLNTIQDVLYPLNSRVARIAATTLGSSGQLATVSGVSGSAAAVNWSLTDAPSWITIDSSGTITVSGVDVPKIGIYEVSVFALDSSNPSNFSTYPLTIEVLPAFYLREASSLTNISITALDSNVSNTIHAYGSDNTTQLTDVKYSVVGSLFAGLNLRTSKDNAVLYGNLKTLSDLRGGVTSVGPSQSVQIKAFKEGTFHDHPDRAAILTLNYTVADAAPGDIETAISGYVDSSSSPFIRLHARSDIRAGKGSVSSYAWTATGTATGTFLDSANASTTTWSPTATGQVTFTLVTGGIGTNLSTYTPATLTLDIATGTSWTSSGKLKIIPADVSKLETQGYSSQVTTFGTKLTDLQSGQIATLTLTVTPIGSAPVASAPAITVNGTPTNQYTDVNSTNGDIALISFTIPSGATIGDKYVIQVSAATASNTRVGSLTYYVVCTGDQKVIVTPSNSNININNGVSYSIASPIITLASSQSGMDFELVNAPSGLYLDPNGNLLGKAFIGQSGAMRVYYSKAGFLTEDYITINYVVNEVVGLIAPTLSTTTPVIAPGSSLRVDWGFSGTALNFYLKKDSEPEIELAGNITTYTFTSLTTNTTIGLRAVSAVGESFAAPIDIIVSTSGIISRLPQSPTIAYLYQDNTVELNWSPIPIGADSAHYYDYYGHWSVWYKYSSSSTEFLVPFLNLTGLETGGDLAARKTSFSLVTNPPSPTDTVYIDMQAISTNEATILSSFRWGKSDSNPPFPMLSFPSFGTVTLDKDTAAKSEPIKVTISGFTGDKWRIVFQDGTSTSFLPMSVTSMVISFTTGGVNEQMRIEVESDFSSSLPSVRMRSVVNKSIFIIDQDYVAPSTTDPLGNIGFGGESGFEITDATSGAVALQPYISIVRSLVKDETTNELKLMVSTSRTQDGSSSLGTMALDVFPILGRPHIKDLIKPLSTTAYTSEILTPVKITTDLIQDIIIGQFTEIKLSSSGGTGPFSWYANSLPAGLNISTDGTIYGSVFQLGTYGISVSIADSSNPVFIDEKTFNLVVKSDLKISTTSISNATINSLYSQVLATTGGVGPFQWSLVGGELPIGLSVNPETGVIEGRPVTYNNSDFSKTFTFVVQVVDSVGARASKQLTIGLNPAALSVTSIDQPIIYRGERFRLVANILGGTPPYSNLVVSDPSGILTTGNSRIQDGSIEFDVPETVAAGNYSYTISVTDYVGTTVSKSLTYSVRPYLGEFRVTGTYIDNVYTALESLDHYIPVTTVAGATVTLTSPTTPLSNGITVSYNDSTKQLSFKGPVTIGENLEFPVSLTVAGTANDGVITKTFTVNGYTGSSTSIDPSLKAVYTKPYKVGSLITLDTSRPYFNSNTGARDTTRYTRVQPGQKLPTGLSLDTKTGLIYGTLVDTTVNSTILERVETATNNVLGLIPVTFNIKNDKNLILDTSNLGVAKRGLPYTGTVTALAPAQGPLSYSILKGSLPSGVIITPSGNSLVFSGTPTTGGFYDLWIEVSDINGLKDLLYKRLEVNYSNAVSLQTPNIPTITVGTPYSFQLSSIGGVSPYNYSITSGSLPSGITISASGLISGTTNVASYNANITVQVTDSNLSTDSKIYNISTDAGYVITTVTGTSSVGNWPADQPDLSTITRINQVPLSPLKAFTIRVAGLSDNTDKISIDDTNLSISFTTIQTEGSTLVGYAKIVNPSKTSPVTLGIPVGTKNFNVTVYNSATGRTKTQALSYNVLAVDSSTGQLQAITQDGQYMVTPRTGTDEMAFLETGSASVAATTVGSPTYSVFIAGIDLLSHPMDVVANGLVSILEMTPGLSGKFNISYNGIYTNKAIVGLNYTGGEFGTPTSGQYIRLRVNDVAYVDYTGPTTFVMDVFQNPTSIVSPREKKLNVLQLIKATIASNSTSLFLNEPYTFQINFDAPLNLAQNPVVTYSGLQGVTSSSFITNTNGQKVGYKIQGTWAKNLAETYPKLYNINVTMTENLMYVRNSGNNVTSLVTHFNQNIPITVQENTNALGISLNPWDTSSQVTGVYNLYAPNVGYNLDPGVIGVSPVATVSNYAANPQAYKIKIYGTDSSNPVCGNSILNLPIGIKFYAGGTYYTSSDMYNSLLTGGIYVSSGTYLLTAITSTPSGSNFGLNFWQFPTPSVPLATDYSTQAAIIANAIPIQTYTIPVKMELQEVSTGKLAVGLGNIVLKPSMGSDPYRSGVLVLLHYPSGVSTTPDTFVVLAHYYDSNNPNEYVSATFPPSGSWAIFGPAKIYVIGQIPYLSSLTEQFSAISVTAGTGLTVTSDTSSSDPVMIKANTYGINLTDINNNNVFYSKFFTSCYNSYTLSFASGTDVTSKTLSAIAYSGSALDPNFNAWSNTGRKQGRMKYKPIYINVVQDTSITIDGCLPSGSEVLMSDMSKRSIESIVEGDQVFALDESSLTPVISKVIKTYVIEKAHLIEVVTTKRSLICSKDHRLTRNNNILDYPAAKDLEVGDILVYINDDGSIEEVDVLSIEDVGDIATVYHISLEDGHVYIGNNFAAHNKGIINWKTLN